MNIFGTGICVRFIAMSGSNEHDQVALVSINEKAHIEGIFTMNIVEVDFQERLTMLEEVQEVLRRVAQYTEHTSTIQRVCAHPAQIIQLLKEITYHEFRKFLPHCAIIQKTRNRARLVTAERDESWLRL